MQNVKNEKTEVHYVAGKEKENVTGFPSWPGFPGSPAAP